MESRGLRYFIGFVVVIGLLIMLIVLIFGGGGDSKKVPATEKVLSSYATTDSQVSMTVDGSENSASEHRQVVVAVNADRVLYEVKAGYDGKVIDSKSFTNTKSSYEAFLLALEHADFNKGDLEHAKTDPRGFCPLGRRYIFELNDGAKSVQRFWTTSCGKPKTFLGDADTVSNLFENQVPNYRNLIDDVDL